MAFKVKTFEVRRYNIDKTCTLIGNSLFKDRELRKTSPESRQQNHELKSTKNEKGSTHSESSQMVTKAISTDSTSSEQTSQSGQIMEGSAKPSCSTRLLGDEEIQDIRKKIDINAFDTSLDIALCCNLVIKYN